MAIKREKCAVNKAKTIRNSDNRTIIDFTSQSQQNSQNAGETHANS
jgi:hypothetical protein